MIINTLAMKRPIINNKDKQIEELEKNKNNLTIKEYNKKKKQIINEAMKQLKEIDKKYPMKEIIKLYKQEQESNK